MTDIILFGTATLVLIIASRRALLYPRSHGFPRFFGWEALTALLVINLSVWFRDPLSWNQVISWILLIISAIVAFTAFVQFHRGGKPGSPRSEEHLFDLEKTSVLVTTGVFHYIRHPMYSSLIFLGWGIFFKDPSMAGALLAVVATTLLFQTARVEERENIAFFGGAYETYMKRTKRFVPYVF